MVDFYIEGRIYLPDFSLEESLGLSTSAVIVGVDEVGRGPLAGPVTAAAVFFDRQKITSDLLTKIDDSKKIAQKKRAKISKQIESIAIIGIGVQRRNRSAEHPRGHYARNATCDFFHKNKLFWIQTIF